MANRLILIRHPDKAGDKEGVYLGNAAMVTAEGDSQIPLVIARLKLMGPDAVVSSMFPRAVKLAERIAEELGLPIPFRSDLFNEIDKPQFLVGMRREDPVHVEVMQRIRDLFDEDQVPTDLLRGERVKTRSELEEEIRTLLRSVEHFQNGEPVAPNTLLGVTHAKKIAAILHYVYHRGSLKGYYETTDHSIKMSTAGISTLVFEPNRRTGRPEWQILSVNDVAHLDVGFDVRMSELLKKL